MKAYPERILAAALVPIQASIDELQWSKENGFCSVVLDKVFPVKHHLYGEVPESYRELWRNAQQLFRFVG